MPTTALDRLIDREVFTLANELASELQSQNPDWFDDAENLSRETCPHCGKHVTEEELLTVGDNGYENTCPHCGASDPTLESEPVEVMQWFLVSDWLMGELKDQGEPVWQVHGVNFWGRTGCGYALTEEPALKAIAKGGE